MSTVRSSIVAEHYTNKNESTDGADGSVETRKL